MDSLTAIILCGGRGERLRPLSDSVPKPLLPANGRPILDYLLEHLSHSGIRDFLLCVGYRAEMFEHFVSQRASGPERVRCLNSGEAGITERLCEARPLVPGRALVCYGDTLADLSIRGLMKSHRSSRADATITVYPYRSPFGIVTFDEAGVVSRFEEKPRLPYWINVGFLLLEPAALNQLRPEVPLPGFLSRLAARRKLGVHRHRGRHWTANTETELRELATDLRL
ncbi:MAG: nucleotidyltransferase family protein, partial [Limisphaerales bacterium]